MLFHARILNSYYIYTQQDNRWKNQSQNYDCIDFVGRLSHRSPNKMQQLSQRIAVNFHLQRRKTHAKSEWASFPLSSLPFPSSILPFFPFRFAYDLCPPVNIPTERHTDRQATFWPTHMNSTTSWAKTFDQRHKEKQGQSVFFSFYRAMRSLERIVALLSWCSSVCLSVCPSVYRTGVHCDHTVHFSADSYVRFVLGTLTPKHVHLLPAVFSSSTRKRGGVWMCKLRLEVNTNIENIDKYAVHRWI